MQITPKTKIGELLDAFPQLEPVLISMSPAFEKLKNPILRRTVARVATIQQISVVGGISVDTIINRLRKEVGQQETADMEEHSGFMSPVPPDWFDPARITITLDATPLINAGGSPMSDVLKKASLLRPGDIFELRTPFIPAPILDMLKEKKYRIYCTRVENLVNSYIAR